MNGPADAVVREGRERDLEQLTVIYNHYVVNTPVSFDLEPYTVDRHREWFGHYNHTGAHRLLVAVDGSAVLGYTTSSPFHTRPAYASTVESSVYCESTAVGRGIGTLLYDHLFAALAGEHLHRVMAGIALPNDASCRLHQRFGFTEVGVEHEVGYKFDQYWDVLLLERPID
jgi:phosphinothricin acetyltransferase